MKTMVALVAAICLVAAAPAAGAAKSRKVTEEYSMASGAFISHGGSPGGEAHWTLGSEYAQFRAAARERAVSLSVEDASGGAVRAHVHIDQDGDGKLDKQLDFCGSTTDPIAVKPGAVIEVGTIVGTCDDTTPSIVTEGTITATFSR